MCPPVLGNGERMEKTMKKAIIRTTSTLAQSLAALVELRAAYRASFRELAPVPTRHPEMRRRGRS